MGQCSNCGTELGPATKFCPECGTPTAVRATATTEEVEPVVGSEPTTVIIPDADQASSTTELPTTPAEPPPPPDAPPSPAAEPPPAAPADGGAPTAAAAVPSWARSDWPLVAVVAAALLGALALAGAVWGLLMGIASNGFRPEGYVGAVAGLFLGFAGLGADTGVIAQAGDGGLLWAWAALSPTVVLGVAFLGRTLLRFGLRRASTLPRHDLAFVVKFVVTTTLLVAVVGSLVSIGDFDEGVSGNGFEVAATIGIGEAAWWTFTILALVGAWELVGRNRLARPSWMPSAPALSTVAAGAVAAATVVLVLGVLTTVGAVIVADDANERVTGVLAAPLVAGNAGSAAHSVALGASAGVGAGVDVEVDDDVRDHVSLFNWGLPPDSEAGGAPPWLLPLLLVAPAMAGWTTWRRLSDHDGATLTGQGAIGIGLLVMVGYAVGSWFLALVAPLAGAGVASSNDSFDFVFRAGIARPSVAATLGLSALWSLVGAAVATVLWANAHGVDLLRAGAAGTQPAAAAPEPAAAARCTNCGSALEPSDAFCSTCGTPASATGGGPAS